MEEQSQTDRARTQALTDLKDCFSVLRSLDPVEQRDAIRRLMRTISDIYAHLDSLK